MGLYYLKGATSSAKLMVLIWSITNEKWKYIGTYPLNGTIDESSSQRQDTGDICSPQGDFSSNFFLKAAFGSTSTVSPSGQLQDSNSFGLQAGLPSLNLKIVRIR